jgi:hypothetical protein
MDNTKRIITIIGLIFEGLGVAGTFFGLWILRNMERIPSIQLGFEEMTDSEYEATMAVFNLLESIVSVMVIILSILFVISLYLFIKLLKGKYTEEQAKKVYLYQAIWGGINLLSNQITGILYLVSGVGGYNGQREETDIRQGI